MENWTLLVVAAGGLFLAGLVIKTLVGLGLQYVGFVALAGYVLHRQSSGTVEFTAIDTLAGIAIAGGIAFAITLATTTLFFRKSGWKIVLFPLVGVGTTIAAVAAVVP